MIKIDDLPENVCMTAADIKQFVALFPDPDDQRLAIEIYSQWKANRTGAEIRDDWAAMRGWIERAVNDAKNINTTKETKTMKEQKANIQITNSDFYFHHTPNGWVKMMRYKIPVYIRLTEGEAAKLERLPTDEDIPYNKLFPDSERVEVTNKENRDKNKATISENNGDNWWDKM